MTHLTRQSARQCRCILPLSQTDLEGCLRRLARVLYEQANQFYLDDSRRILAAHAEQRTPPPELNCRICFKVPFCSPRLGKQSPGKAHAQSLQDRTAFCYLRWQHSQGFAASFAERQQDTLAYMRN